MSWSKSPKERENGLSNDSKAALLQMKALLRLLLLSHCCRQLSVAFTSSPTVILKKNPSDCTTSPKARRAFTVLHAKKKKDSVAGAASLSSMDSLIKMVVPGPRTSSMESGIEVALILTDKKRQETWKKDMRQDFPLVPSFVIDVCIDALSQSFSVVAPAQLKAALRPGGLEKARPGLHKTIVSNLENQVVIKSVPLKAEDKRHLLQHLVSMSLDYVLKDAELMLAEPAVKLQALDLQKKQIQKYMTLRQLAWYRIRYYPIQTALLSAASIYLAYSLAQQTKHTWIISTVTGTVASIVSQMQRVAQTILKMLGLSGKKSIKRRVVRRVVR